MIHQLANFLENAAQWWLAGTVEWVLLVGLVILLATTRRWLRRRTGIARVAVLPLWIVWSLLLVCTALLGAWIALYIVWGFFGRMLLGGFIAMLLVGLYEWIESLWLGRKKSKSLLQLAVEIQANHEIRGSDGFGRDNVIFSKERAGTAEHRIRARFASDNDGDSRLLRADGAERQPMRYERRLMSMMGLKDIRQLDHLLKQPENPNIQLQNEPPDEAYECQEREDAEGDSNWEGERNAKEMADSPDGRSSGSPTEKESNKGQR